MKRNHIAIARKAARTRRRMKKARLISSEKITLDGSGFRRQFRMFARLLPCPDFGAKR